MNQNRIAEYHYNKGAELQQNGRLEDAIIEYNEAIELNPNYAWAYYTRASANNIAGHYDQAIADCTKAFELDPVFTEACILRGQIYAKQGKKAEAIAIYEKFIAFSDNSADIEKVQGWIDELSK